MPSAGLSNMMSTITFGLTAFATLAPSVSAHMFLQSPKPYGNPDNGPLDASGSNFPCKVGFASSPSTDWPVGSQQNVQFTGSAVHGGGSCQVSLSEPNPTKSSKWKVIYSIEGGCPVSAAGNLADGSGTNLKPFTFTVPSEVPNGEYVAAVTWFNKIGNREMYMYCSNVNVSGGKADKSAFNALPDMAVANIGGTSSTCKTKEGSDYTFENPGKYKQQNGSGPFQSLCGGAASNGNGNGNGTPAQSASPVASPAVSSFVTKQPAATAPAAKSTIKTLITVTAPSAPQASTQAPAAAKPVQTPASGSGTTSGTTCTSDGATLCNGTTQFGICNHGKVVWQAVAPGTTCQGGQIQKREYSHRNQRSVLQKM